ncbi:MAG: glutathione S-transferase family protein [Maricaulaceae bacterium]
MKLFTYATSPYGAKVYFYCLYKNIAFDTVYVDPVRKGEIKPFGFRQVPVLSIGETARIESTDLGCWLDDVFPEPPLLPSDRAARGRVLEIVRWVDDELIHYTFRSIFDSETATSWLTRGWRLGAIVKATSGVPSWTTPLWPILLRRAGFIRRIVASRPREEPMAWVRARHVQEFLSYLGEGPFLAAQPRPTLADLSVYARLWLTAVTGGLAFDAFMAKPAVRAWIARVEAQLPRAPTLIPERFRRNRYPLAATPLAAA